MAPLKAQCHLPNYGPRGGRPAVLDPAGRASDQLASIPPACSRNRRNETHRSLNRGKMFLPGAFLGATPPNLRSRFARFRTALGRPSSEARTGVWGGTPRKESVDDGPDPIARFYCTTYCSCRLDLPLDPVREASPDRCPTLTLARTLRAAALAFPAAGAAHRHGMHKPELAALDAELVAIG